MRFADFYVPEKDKTFDWGCRLIDGFSLYGLFNVVYTRERRKDFNNYEFVKGEYRVDQFKYLMERYGEVTPARMVHYPLLNVKIDKITGDWLEQPFKFYAYVTDKDGVEKKLTTLSKIKAEMLTRPHRAAMEKMTGVDMSNQDVYVSPQADPNTFTPKEEMEVFNELYIQDIIMKYDIAREYQKALRDFCICSKGFLYVDIVNGDPVTERIDPRSAIYDFDMMKNDSNNCGWFARERFLSATDIFNEYREWLTKEDVAAIKLMTASNYDTLVGDNADLAHYYMNNTDGTFRIRVVDCWWVSTKEEEWKVTEKENDFGQINKHYSLLGEDYKKKHKGFYKNLAENGRIVRKEADDCWRGTKIGFSVYTRVERQPNQPRCEKWGWQKSMIPIKFVVADAIDGATMSVVDRGKNVQLMWNVVMFHVDLLLSRSMGNVLTYDLAFMPDSLQKSQVMAYVKNEGFMFYDSRKEGVRDNSRSGGLSSTNASNVGDIVALMQFAEYLERMLDNITGLNRAWQGNMKASDGAHNTANSVQQADSIMRPLYEAHSHLCEMSLNGMANIIKYAHLEEGDRMSFVMDDTIVKNYTVPKGFSLADCGVKLLSGISEAAKMQQLNEMTNAALQSGALDFEGALNTFDAPTATQAKIVFKQGIDIMKKNMAQQQQAENQQAQAALAQKAQAAGTPIEVQKLKSETAIEVAKITATKEFSLQGMEQDLAERLFSAQARADIGQKMMDQQHEAGEAEQQRYHDAMMQQGQQEADAAQQKNEPAPQP